VHDFTYPALCLFQSSAVIDFQIFLYFTLSARYAEHGAELFGLSQAHVDKVQPDALTKFADK
jgi:hypothetical protein